MSAMAERPQGQQQQEMEEEDDQAGPLLLERLVVSLEPF